LVVVRGRRGIAAALNIFIAGRWIVGEVYLVVKKLFKGKSQEVQKDFGVVVLAVVGI
jgi:hypothetical protein